MLRARAVLQKCLLDPIKGRLANTRSWSSVTSPLLYQNRGTLHLNSKIHSSLSFSRQMCSYESKGGLGPQLHFDELPSPVKRAENANKITKEDLDWIFSEVPDQAMNNTVYGYLDTEEKSRFLYVRMKSRLDEITDRIKEEESKKQNWYSLGESLEWRDGKLYKKFVPLNFTETLARQALWEWSKHEELVDQHVFKKGLQNKLDWVRTRRGYQALVRMGRRRRFIRRVIKRNARLDDRKRTREEILNPQTPIAKFSQALRNPVKERRFEYKDGKAELRELRKIEPVIPHPFTLRYGGYAPKLTPINVRAVEVVPYQPTFTRKVKDFLKDMRAPVPGTRLRELRFPSAPSDPDSLLGMPPNSQDRLLMDDPTADAEAKNLNAKFEEVEPGVWIRRDVDKLVEFPIDNRLGILTHMTEEQYVERKKQEESLEESSMETDRLVFRDISPEDVEKLPEEHRKYVSEEGKIWMERTENVTPEGGTVEVLKVYTDEMRLRDERAAFDHWVMQTTRVVDPTFLPGSAPFARPELAKTALQEAKEKQAKEAEKAQEKNQFPGAQGDRNSTTSKTGKQDKKQGAAKGTGQGTGQGTGAGTETGTGKGPKNPGTEESNAERIAAEAEFQKINSQTNTRQGGGSLFGRFGFNPARTRAVKRIIAMDQNFALEPFIKWHKRFFIPRYIKAWLEQNVDVIRRHSTQYCLRKLQYMMEDTPKFEHLMSYKRNMTIHMIKTCELVNANVVDNVGNCILSSSSRVRSWITDKKTGMILAGNPNKMRRKKWTISMVRNPYNGYWYSAGMRSGKKYKGKKILFMSSYRRLAKYYADSMLEIRKPAEADLLTDLELRTIEHELYDEELKLAREQEEEEERLKAAGQSTTPPPEAPSSEAPPPQQH